MLTMNAITLFILFHMHLDRPEHGARGNRPADFIIKQLNLDDQQQKQFADLRNQHQQIVRSEESEDHRLHVIYFGMLKTDEPDKSRVDSVATLIGDQRKKLATATFDHFLQLRALCRPDQKKLFDETVDEIAKMIGGPPPGAPPPLHPQ